MSVQPIPPGFHTPTASSLMLDVYVDDYDAVYAKAVTEAMAAEDTAS